MNQKRQGSKRANIGIKMHWGAMPLEGKEKGIDLNRSQTLGHVS